MTITHSVAPVQSVKTVTGHSSWLQQKCACGQAAGLQSKCVPCSQGQAFGLQKKTLTIGAADDPLEREADRAAEQALRGDTPAQQSRSAAQLSRRTTLHAEGDCVMPASVSNSLSAPGEALERGLRDELSARFAHDFGKVRVHHDAAAAQSARDVDAHAYTVGTHLVFGAGRFAPHSVAGRHLLAHELAHVVQQSSAPAPVLQRAEILQGKVRIQIDYSPVSRVSIAQRPDRIVAQMAALLGAPASAAQEAAARAADNAGQQWLLFALQLLSLNKAAASTLNLSEAVNRLTAHTSGALHRPLPDLDHLFVQEVLRVSGWSQTAQGERLNAPSATDRAAIDVVVNPVPSTGTAGSPLNTAAFNRRLPPALTHLLRQIDPASWASVGTRSLSAFQAIGNVVQAEARSFFSPYADAAIGNLYDLQPAWHAAANIFDVTATPPTADQRIGYLLNRAEIVGRSRSVTTHINDANIFDQTHFNSGRPTDRVALMAVVTALEGDATIRPIVNRLLQHTGRKSGTGAATTIGLVTEFNAGTASACADHWRGVATLCHEVLHALVHPDFNAIDSRVSFPQVIREGFTEVLGAQLFNDRVLPNAASNAVFKNMLEAGVTGAPCGTPAAYTIGYGTAGSGAEAIRARVGNDNFRAAYFLGRPELVGMT